jgi:hypothetical protein
MVAKSSVQQEGKSKSMRDNHGEHQQKIWEKYPIKNEGAGTIFVPKVDYNPCEEIF